MTELEFQLCRLADSLWDLVDPVMGEELGIALFAPDEGGVSGLSDELREELRDYREHLTKTWRQAEAEWANCLRTLKNFEFDAQIESRVDRAVAASWELLQMVVGNHLSGEIRDAFTEFSRALRSLDLAIRLAQEDDTTVPDDLISMGEAADIAECSSRTIRRRIDDGSLQAFGPNRRVSEREVRAKARRLLQRRPRTSQTNSRDTERTQEGHTTSQVDASDSSTCHSRALSNAPLQAVMRDGKRKEIVMLNIANEQLITLKQAAALLPGAAGASRLHVATLHRWANRGCRGVRLETVRVGGMRCTSVEALQRFSQQLTDTAMDRSEVRPESR